MNISMCPDRTTCQNEAMIEELREQVADLTAAFNATVDKLDAVTAERDKFKSMIATRDELMAEFCNERDAANAKLAAIPWQDLRSVFQAADGDGYYNDNVAEWLYENGVKL